jgi:ribA/ribD-fused uncharacterized protein
VSIGIDTNPKRYSLEEMQDRGAVLGFRGRHRFLSNFWEAEVEAYRLRFPSVEHAYVAAKIHPGDDAPSRAAAREKMLEIARTPSPGAVKRLGRALSLRPDWEEVKLGFMTELVRRKFEGHPDLAQMLIDTGDVPIVELNRHGDTIWGMVMSGADDMIGRNMLGEILEARRAALVQVLDPGPAEEPGPP